jgi:hypothetical protein
MLIRGLLLLIALAVPGSGAQARHWHHDGHYGYGRDFDDDALRPDSDQSGELRPPSMQDTGFGPAIARLIRDCGQIGAGLKASPLLQVHPGDETQRRAFEELRSSIANASDALAVDCPKAVPAAPPEMLDALMRAADGLINALDAISPSAEALYNSLNDEQKAHLVADAISDRSSAANPAAQRRSRRSSGRASEAAIAGPDDTCAHWANALRDWPVRQIEVSMPLSDAQHAALYDVAASTYRAADRLIASCPREAALTPLARIADSRKRVDALRHAVEAISPTLAQLAGMLSEDQRRRLSQVVNAGQARALRTRE